MLIPINLYLNHLNFVFYFICLVELAWNELNKLNNKNNWPNSMISKLQLYYRQKRAHGKVPQRLLYLDYIYNKFNNNNDEL